MKDTLSVDQLQSLLHDDEVIHPAIHYKASIIFKPSLVLTEFLPILEYVGLPRRVADWFEAVEVIEINGGFPCFKYCVNGQRYAAKNGILLGVNSFGGIVLDANHGSIVYVEQGGSTQLVNTSFGKFLYFAGRFNRSADRGFEDVNQLLSDCKETDPDPLSDPEGVWSLMLEEAAAGLY